MAEAPEEQKGENTAPETPGENAAPAPAAEPAAENSGGESAINTNTEPAEAVPEIISGTGVAATSSAGHVTSYNYFCNQDDKGAPFGSKKTATGTHSLRANPAENQFTAAALARFSKGDIVLVNANGNQVLLAIDDVGSGDGKGAMIDVTEGPALAALGMKVTAYGAGDGRGVLAISGGGNVTITKVAQYDYRSNLEGFKNVINEIGKINTSQGKIADLKTSGVTFAEGINVNQTVSAAKFDGVEPMAITQQEIETREKLTKGFQYDKNQTEEVNQKAYNDNMLGNLANMDPGEALSLLLLAFIFGLFSGQNLEQVFAQLDNMMGGGLSGAAGSGGYSYPGGGSAYKGGSSVASQGTVSHDGMSKYSPEELARILSESGNSTLKNPSGAREAIKREYVSRLDPYLYTGKISDIPKGAKVAVIDLGHLANASDLGASMNINGKMLCEAGACMEANIAMAQRFHEQGIYVLSTSQSDAFANNTLGPSVRGNFVEGIANVVGKENLIAVFSHYNDGGPSARGFEVYLSGNDHNPNSPAYKMSQDMVASITNAEQGLFSARDKPIRSEYQSQHKGGIGYLRDSYFGFLPEFGFQGGDNGTLQNKEKMQKAGYLMADSLIVGATRELGWQLTPREKPQVAAESGISAPQQALAEALKPKDGEMAKVQSLVARMMVSEEGTTLEIPAGKYGGPRTDAHESIAADGQVTFLGITGMDLDMAERCGFGKLESKEQFEQALINKFRELKTNDARLAWAAPIVVDKYLKKSGYEELPVAMMPLATDMALHRGPAATNWVLHNTALELSGNTTRTPNPGAERGFPGFDDPSLRPNTGFTQEDFNTHKANYDTGLTPAQFALVREQYARDPIKFVETFSKIRIEHHEKDIAFDAARREMKQPFTVEGKGVVYGGSINRSKFRDGWNRRPGDVYNIAESFINEQIPIATEAHAKFIANQQAEAARQAAAEKARTESKSENTSQFVGPAAGYTAPSEVMLVGDSIVESFADNIPAGNNLVGDFSKGSTHVTLPNEDGNPWSGALAVSDENAALFTGRIYLNGGINDVVEGYKENAVQIQTRLQQVINKYPSAEIVLIKPEQIEAGTERYKKNPQNIDEIREAYDRLASANPTRISIYDPAGKHARSDGLHYQDSAGLINAAKAHADEYFAAQVPQAQLAETAPEIAPEAEPVVALETYEVDTRGLPQAFQAGNGQGAYPQTAITPDGKVLGAMNGVNADAQPTGANYSNGSGARLDGKTTAAPVIPDNIRARANEQGWVMFAVADKDGYGINSDKGAYAVGQIGAYNVKTGEYKTFEFASGGKGGADEENTHGPFPGLVSKDYHPDANLNGVAYVGAVRDNYQGKKYSWGAAFDIYDPSLQGGDYMGHGKQYADSSNDRHSQGCFMIPQNQQIVDFMQANGLDKLGTEIFILNKDIERVGEVDDLQTSVEVEDKKKEEAKKYALVPAEVAAKARELVERTGGKIESDEEKRKQTLADVTNSKAIDDVAKANTTEAKKDSKAATATEKAPIDASTQSAGAMLA